MFIQFSRLNFTCTFRTFIYISTNHVNFVPFDNDEMKPSKRQVSLVSLIFVSKLLFYKHSHYG